MSTRSFMTFHLLESGVYVRDHSEESHEEQSGGYFVKTVNARNLQKKIKECVDMSQQDQVVITRRGKPAAMVGVEGKDWEDVVLQTSQPFGSLSRRRRTGAISMKELRPD